MPINSNLILPNENNTAIQNLAVSAAKVALNNFEWRFVTMVFYNSSVVLGLSAFMQVYRKSVVVCQGSFEYDESTRTKIKQFVVFGSDLTNVMHMLDWMQLRQFDNTGKFIVICNNCDVREAMSIFWNHKITNIVYMNGSGTKDTIGFTYSVYDNENCKISPPQPLLRTCIHNSCMKVFHMKLRNFHTCPIIVSTFEQDPYMFLGTGTPRGADGDLLLLITEALNATLKIITSHRGTVWDEQDKDGNKNKSSSLGDVYYDHANFSMTSPFLTLKRIKDFQASISYYSINVVFVTHPAIPLPAWQKLLRPFETNVRICLALTFLFIILVAVFIRSKLWIKNSGQDISRGRPHTCLLFLSWTICMGMPITKLPSKPLFLTIFMLWIYYCYMIRTFYQTSLVYAMTEDFNYPELENLEDILSTSYPIVGEPPLKSLFLDAPEVFNNWKHINGTQLSESMVSLSKGMKFVLVAKKLTALNFITKTHENLHIVPQTIATSPTVLLFKKFSPMVESVNLVLERLNEGGFTHKFNKDHTSVLKTEMTESSVAMNFGHYVGCYFVLVIGWIISIVIFLCEFCHKYSIAYKQSRV